VGDAAAALVLLAGVVERVGSVSGNAVMYLRSIYNTHNMHVAGQGKKWYEKSVGATETWCGRVQGLLLQAAVTY
jgi:hypothetical protein